MSATTTTAIRPTTGTTRRRRPGHRRVTVVVVSAAALVVFAIGCSRDDTAPPSTTPGTATATTAATGTTGRAGTTGTTAAATGSLQLTAAEFADGGEIPKAQVCTNQGGANEAPTLTWTGVPAGTSTLVLVMHDPDAPLAGGFTHWITALEPKDGSLKAEPVAAARPPDAYFGPCPPPGAPHRYEFTLYAFGPDVTLPDKPTKADIDQAASQALATAKLTGIYANPG